MRNVIAASVIKVGSLEVSYGGQPAVRGLTLDIPGGAVTALVGPNGCGKSTLLKSLAGIIVPSRGQILVEDVAVRDYAARQLARKIALLPQVLPIPEGITVRQLVAYGRSPYSGLWGTLRSGDDLIVASALKQLDIETLANRQVTELSGGQRQRVWIAMILAQQTPIILMDEPTTFLDINHQIEVFRFVRKLADEGKAVVLVLHDLNQAFRYADKVAVMFEGRIVEAGRPEVVADEKLLRDVFRIDAVVVPDPEAGTPMVVVKNQT